MTPDRLMDVVFPARDQSPGKIVAALSEPETGRAADNLVTNEDSFARVANDLRLHSPQGGVYLGVGPDQNFTYIAHALPRLAFVVDFRRRNALLHLMHKALFAIALDRASYLEKLIARHHKPLPRDPSPGDLVASFEGHEMDRSRLDATIAEVASYLRPLEVVADDEWTELSRIQSKLAGPGLKARFLALPMYPTLGQLVQARDRLDHPAHFLAREDWYQDVRARHIGDRIIPLVGDFAGTHCFESLGGWLRLRGLAVSVFYASDVEFFLLRSGRFAAYAANLAKLPWAEGALVLRTSTREIAHPERSPGESSTTILRSMKPFLEAAQAGRIKSLEDLFH